ncbi:MAG TPA: amino acid adenylation domain-containing protein [Blastocatellia bacterium]|nr:amino acid adenylation domain-containing protein [Blastocatellia bacterium]
MRREREVVLGAFGNQEVPFERVVEQVRPERSLSYSPLFQVAFNFLNAARQSEIRLSELSLTSLGGEVETSKFDLVLVITEDDSRLFIDLRYSTDLFDESTIKRMLTHFQRLIEAAVADPRRPISALPMLTEAEVRQLLVERNDTSSPYPRHDCVHQLFERRASYSPEAVALACEAKQLSYAELNRRANQMANYLRSLGVGPETLVGVCMKGSIDMVVATLGILKAGGAFVPLDPDYPKRRLALMMEESTMPVLLTQEDMEDRLPAHWGRTVFVDSDWETIELHSGENPASDVDPENLAYVIFTSGSTGKPKGVQITHGALLNLVYWHKRDFAVTPADRATQVAGVAFDASVWEVWPYLAAGASVHFPSDEIRSSPTRLRDWLVSEGITISFLPTPLAESLLSLDWSEETSLRALLTGGDKLHRHPSKTLPFDLVNNYGPTENTVVATSGRVPVRPHEEAAPSIGRPIDNTQVYLLDSDLQLVPDGVPGELYIGGSSLARGYLLQPETTAQAFIPNPFSDRPGARLYRTGDLVRYSADGSIEFLSRVDDQVKVRGFRIELGEIEAALSRHPALQDALVIAREDTPGENRLVAYLVCKPDQAPNISEMRAYLKERLPDYMIPQAFVTLDALPLTENGKVDRRALPVPGQSRPQLERDFVAPRNELERFLADRWREVLGIEEVGIYDDFFDIGGESLKAAVLVNKLQQELGEMLQVVSIFDAPNIAAFADYLNKDCPAAVSRLMGNEPQHERAPAVVGKIDSGKVDEFRRLIRPLPPRARRDPETAPKIPPAIFILSSPRSGSTLLRVMLGGHPLLFAPPELELLSFNTLEERRAAFSGRNSFWLEGAIRAVMEIKGCDAEEAKGIMEECEGRKLTTRQFYGLIEEWLGERMLVDKTPSYAMDLEVLNRAETDFNGALFIHLLRSPQGMIRSYEEAKLDQIFPRFKHPFSAREVAELVWVVSHQNILRFLSRVSEERQHRIRFEELVNEPEAVMRGICRFLGIEFDFGMMQPYEDKEKKMTNGIHTVSRMLGDIKFHQHSGIDPAAAESWRKYYPDDFLGDVTLELAESLGYEREGDESRPAGPSPKAITPIRPVAGDSDAERILANLDRLSNEQVDALLDDMLAKAQDKE